MKTVLGKIAGVPVVRVTEGTRIKQSEQEEGYYYYAMRHGDSDWSEPITLEKGVLVNYFGALVTTEPISLLEKNFIAGIDLTEEDITNILEWRE